VTPPKKIYLYPDVGNKSLVKTWFEQQMTKDCLPYFSEQAIREAALDMLNTSWADSNFDKAIEFMIDQLEGGNNG
jgi:hypothetical protein